MSDDKRVPPTDAWRDDTRRPQPGGTAASGKQSEGAGRGYEDGRTHTGWGPVDSELADKEAADRDGQGHTED